MKDKDTHLLEEAYNTISERRFRSEEDYDDAVLGPYVEEETNERLKALLNAIENRDTTDEYDYFDRAVTAYTDSIKMDLDDFMEIYNDPNNESEEIVNFFGFVEDAFKNTIMDDLRGDKETKGNADERDLYKRDPAAYYGVKGMR